MDLSPLIPLAPGAAVVAVYWQRRRAGGDPLGPTPTAALPDTTLPLAAAVLLWLLIGAFVLPAALSAWGIDRDSGFATKVIVGPAVNLLVALAMVRAATSGPPRAVLPAWKLVVAGVLGAFVVFGVQHVVGIAIQQAYALCGGTLPTQEVVKQAQAATGTDVLASAAAAILMAPFAEEVFFRGLLLPALARLRGQRAALALQAVLFGAIHVIHAPDTWPLAIPLAVIGWGAGWFYLRTGSLAVPIVLHATFNAISFAAIRASD
jgi:membrane protease YdiL (CAAX protease family)